MKSSNVSVFFLIAAMALLIGCSGSGNSSSPTLVSIAVTPVNPTVILGSSEQFMATGTYSDTSMQDVTTLVNWESSTPAVAAVSNASGFKGLATSLTTGATVITAVAGNLSDSVILTVNPAALVFIDVQPATSSLATGSSQQYTATGTFSDNSTQDLTTSVTWTSSIPDVALVSNATATAVAAGTTMIMAKSGNVPSSALFGDHGYSCPCGQCSAYHREWIALLPGYVRRLSQ